MLWYNGDVINQKVMALAGALTPFRASPKPAQKRCATMDKPIVSHFGKRKTDEDYHALAAKRGIKWLGPLPAKVSERTLWECPKGHTFSLNYTHMRDPRYGCFKCARWQPEDYEQAARERGFTWLGPYPTNAHTPTRWRCPEGHEWEVGAHGLRGCNVCSHKDRNAHLRLTPDHYRALAAKYGVKWLGPETRNNAEQTNWRCEQGHEWVSDYRSFRGCTICNYPHRAEKRRNTPDDYRALAAERGLIWLGPEVTASSKRTKWQCPHGHVWETSYGCIQGGCGCRTCAYEQRFEAHRRKADAYVAVAEARGYVWLGPEVRSTKYATNWQCPNGHIWSASFNNFQKGTNCPRCLGYVNGVRVSEQQKQLAALVGGELNYKVGRYSVDVALPELMFALEYDCHYWHKGSEVKDRARAQKLIALGWNVLRVKASTMLPTVSQLDAAFEAFRRGQSYQEIVLADWGAAGK